VLLQLIPALAQWDVDAAKTAGWEPALTRVQQYRAKGFDESDL